MASSLASDKPSLPAPGAAPCDPFVITENTTTTPAHHRYSQYDHEFFVTGPASPESAKRALAAHLQETERRLEEAGKLGNALVAQRKELTEQLKEIEKVNNEEELSQELRERMVDIEKEFNTLTRESARNLLPKQRVPSNEAHPSSPFAPENKGPRVVRCHCLESINFGLQIINAPFSSDPSALPSLRSKQLDPLRSSPSPIARFAINLPTESTISNSPPRSVLRSSPRFAISKVSLPKEMKRTRISRPPPRDLSLKRRDFSSASSHSTKARTDTRRRTGTLKPSCKS